MTALPERCRTFRCPTPTNCGRQGYCAARGQPADEAQAQAWQREAFDHRMTQVELKLFHPMLTPEACGK